MRIGDVEYTRHVSTEVVAGLTTEVVTVAFALGIKVRPLLTRVQASIISVGAATGNRAIFFENGTSVPANINPGALLLTQAMYPLLVQRQTLVTSGFPLSQTPLETLWWKILMPEINVHFHLTTASDEGAVILHYRFVELTDDEIIEIAAQRSQS